MFLLVLNGKIITLDSSEIITSQIVRYLLPITCAVIVAMNQNMMNHFNNIEVKFRIFNMKEWIS